MKANGITPLSRTYDAQTVPLSFMPDWRYADRGWTRDLRIDFMRGFVFLMLFTSHFPFFSWYALIGWERIGVVSSAEVFIVLAGIVTGSVYGKKLKTDGLGECTIKLFRRAWTLYKIAVIVGLSIALLRLVPGLDTTALTSFTDPVTRQSYVLYPEVSAGLLSSLLHVLVLAASPHQFQIVGLYVALFALTPLIFWGLARDRLVPMLVLSWACYLISYLVPEQQPGTAMLKLTVAQFENAFPLLAWQLLFVHGIAAGYYRQTILRFFSTKPGHMLITACIVLMVSLLWFSLNHPLEQLPEWSKVSVIPQDVFNAVYQAYFLKYKLGPGRLLNVAVLFVTAFVILTVAWKPIYRAFGWLFIPLGQESMYVFFVHVYLILILYNTPLSTTDSAWLNTAIHTSLLLICWLMVKSKFLFKWLPH